MAEDEDDAATPAAAVWDKITARIDQAEAARDTLTVRGDEGVWEPSSPGVARKLLHIDADAGWQAFLLKIDPGASVPPHGHRILEECLVLEGAFEIGDETVRQGDLHLAFPGRDHREIVSPTGALLYIRAALTS
jgi:anti-sigma factor ChrR (cupin superfamily)